MPFWWIHDAWRLAFCAVLLCLSIWGFRALKNQRAWVRVPLRILAVLVCIIDGLLLCLLIFGIFAMDSHSALIFSPDHHHAAQIWNTDGGAIGGDTSVTIYSDWGFKRELVLWGMWDVVEQKDVHWNGNSELLITYRNDPPNCSNTKSIAVHCVPAPLH